MVSERSLRLAIDGIAGLVAVLTTELVNSKPPTANFSNILADRWKS